MKLFKFIAAFLLLTLITNSAFCQLDKRYKIMCTTTSCCGAGLFSIEIWSHTSCIYLSSQNRGTQNPNGAYTLVFEPTKPIDAKILTVNEDVLLSGMLDANGNTIILPKGEYVVDNNSIDFNAAQVDVVSKLKKYCYQVVAHGTIFGHAYNYDISICIEINVNKATNTSGSVSITPTLNESEIKLLKSSNSEFVLEEDIVVKENDLYFTISKGKYFINEDGKAYLQNYKVN